MADLLTSEIYMECYLCKEPLSEHDAHTYIPDSGKMTPSEYQAAMQSKWSVDGPKKYCHLVCVARKCFANWTGSWD